MRKVAVDDFDDFGVFEVVTDEGHLHFGGVLFVCIGVKI